MTITFVFRLTFVRLCQFVVCGSDLATLRRCGHGNRLLLREDFLAIPRATPLEAVPSRALWRSIEFTMYHRNSGIVRSLRRLRTAAGACRRKLRKVSELGPRSIPRPTRVHRRYRIRLQQLLSRAISYQRHLVRNLTARARIQLLRVRI